MGDDDVEVPVNAKIMEELKQDNLSEKDESSTGQSIGDVIKAIKSI